MINYKEKVQILYKKGLIHIFITSAINKVIALLTNMVIVRALSKSDFGVFSYAYNIITTIMILSNLGMDVCNMQYSCEADTIEHKNSIAKFTFNVGIITNLIFSIITVIIVSIVPLSIPEGRTILIFLSFLIIIQFVYVSINNQFRINKENKDFAINTNIQTISYFIFSCSFAFLFGIYGTAIGCYIGFIIPSMYGIYLMRGKIKLIFASKPLDISEKFSIIKYGLLIILTNVVSGLLYRLDIYIVGLVSNSSISIASYKIASILPSALSFITSALITFAYPYFVEHMNDYDWIKKYYQKMQISMMILSGVISVFSILAAPIIIKLIFGNNYIDSIKPFKILICAFFVTSCFRVLSGNVLAMLRKIKVNLILSILICPINILVDYYLIKYYGSIGAAIATLIIVIISSLAAEIYLRFYVLNKSKITR